MIKTHGEIITEIHNIFKNSSFIVDFDSTKNNIEGERIYLKYTGEIKNKETISNYKSGGILRIFIYDKNPTLNWKKTDELLSFLDDKNVNGLEFNEFLISNSPHREQDGDLFVSFIDFEVKTCRGSL